MMVIPQNATRQDTKFHQKWIRANFARRSSAHRLAENVTEQIPADDRGGDIESGRCRR